MKAKYVVSETVSEIVLPDGTSYLSKKNESTDDFYVRVAGIVDEKYSEPLQLAPETTIEKLKRNATADLEKKMESSQSKVEIKMIKIILDERSGNSPVAKKEKAPAAKKEKAPAAKKEKAPKPTSEDVKQAQEESKKNIGKLITFTPQSGQEAIEGTIKGLMTDKRVNFVYYRIIVGQKAYHKRVNSDEIIIKNG